MHEFPFRAFYFIKAFTDFLAANRLFLIPSNGPLSENFNKESTMYFDHFVRRKGMLDN